MKLPGRLASIHAATSAAALAIVLASQACGSWPRRERAEPQSSLAEDITVKMRANLPGDAAENRPVEETPEPAETARLKPLLEAQFAGEGRAAFPPSSSGSVQRLAFARAEARRAALRSLAAEISIFQLGDGQKLESVFAANSIARERMTDELEKSASVQYRETPNEVLAQAAIAGGALGRVVVPGMAALPRTVRVDITENRPRTREQRRAEAQKLALQGARDMLRRRILDSQFDGRSIESLVRDDPGLGERIERLVEQAEPADVTFDAEGACEVTLTLDGESLRRVLR